jgi:hypothetical protein
VALVKTSVEPVRDDPISPEADPAGTTFIE